MEVNTEKIMEEIRAQVREEQAANVDIEKIMQEIREQVRAQGIKEDIPRFDDIPIDDSNVDGNGQNDWEIFMHSLRYMNQGYDIPYYWELGPKHVKTFVKRLIRKVLKFLIPPIVERQNTFNAHTVRCLNTTRYFMEDQRVYNTKADKVQASVEALNRSVEKLQDSNLELHKVIDNMNSRFVQQAQDNEKRMQNLENCMTSISKHIEQLDRQSDDISSNVAQAIIKYGNVPIHTADKPVNSNPKDSDDNSDDDNAYQELDYFKFQNAFRGSRALIYERQEMYLPYYQNQSLPILDIGCGRGEFLQLMRDHGISAYGVDLYPEYVIEGELHGLDIRQGDGIAHLKNSDKKFGGIFVGQVIEHISFEQLITLCKCAYERLEKGSYLIMETPNPMSLSIYTSSFYIDPTHNKPVHPLTLEYILREMGFDEVKTVFTDCSRPEQLPQIKSNAIDNLEDVNKAIERVSNMLYGSQDYAVVARK